MIPFAFPSLDQPPQAILVGGSAGAIGPISQLVAALPADFATPVVVVVHLPRSRPSALLGALRGTSRLVLREPLDKEPLAPATVYLAPPDYHLLIDPGPVLALSVDEPVHFSRPSLDVLFQSAAEVLGSRCAALLLSGSSADGARGLYAIRQAGGRVAIQDPDDAVQAAMPNAALALCPDAARLSSSEISQWVQERSAWQTSRHRGAR